MNFDRSSSTSTHFNLISLFIGLMDALWGVVSGGVLSLSFTKIGEVTSDYAVVVH